MDCFYRDSRLFVSRNYQGEQIRNRNQYAETVTHFIYV